MPEPAAVCDRCGLIIMPKQSYVTILRHVERMGRYGRVVKVADSEVLATWCLDCATTRQKLTVNSRPRMARRLGSLT